MRQKEARACCDALSVEPTFWQLPFYDVGKQRFGDDDRAIVDSFVHKISPDIIFLIDEANDPHGTHRIVRDLVLDVLQKSPLGATVLGYRVWEEGYSVDESNLVLFFDQRTMEEKKKN